MKRRIVLVCSLSLMGLLALPACGPDDDENDTGVAQDTSGTDTGTDTSMPDTDEGDADTGVEEDTGEMDTGEMDTGEMDTGEMDTGEMDADDNDGETMGDAASVTVENQTVASPDHVTVPEAVSVGPGWLVIHEQNEAGDSFAAVIGWASLEDGSNPDVSVELNRNIEEGETLYAMIHQDTGEQGTYEFGDGAGEDAPAKNAAGDVAVKPFDVSYPDAPALAVEDQTVAADALDTVTVPMGVVSAQGFMVIHEDDGGSFGGVVGWAQLDSGVNTDVEVVLDRDVASDGETLHAMLHEDTGETGTYEFGDGSGEDGPITDGDGNVVVTPFDVSRP